MTQGTTNYKHGVTIVDGEAPESDEGMHYFWFLAVYSLPQSFFSYCRNCIIF